MAVTFDAWETLLFERKGSNSQRMFARSKNISKVLKKFGFEIDRMKTGTPPRIDGRTINFSELEEQRGDEGGGIFSYLKKMQIHLHSIQPCFYLLVLKTTDACLLKRM